MNAKHVESKFAMMGARLKISVAPEQRVSNDFAVDIQKDRLGEFFELRVPETLRQSLDVSVLQTDKADRHLLLFARRPEGILESGRLSAKVISERYALKHGE